LPYVSDTVPFASAGGSGEAANIPDVSGWGARVLRNRIRGRPEAWRITHILTPPSPQPSPPVRGWRGGFEEFPRNFSEQSWSPRPIGPGIFARGPGAWNIL
jgi:hypothetical protein